jgi:hypothetical protein
MNTCQWVQESISSYGQVLSRRIALTRYLWAASMRKPRVILRAVHCKIKRQG